MVADADTDADVVTVKLALLLPAWTGTLAGVDATGLSLESETVSPPVGAAVLRYTTPVLDAPPTTLEG
jgi:hypothetical protein